MKIVHGAAHEQFTPSARRSAPPSRRRCGATTRCSSRRPSQPSRSSSPEGAIISADPGVHVKKLRQLVELGATIAVMNCSGADPEGAIRTYGEHVLPNLR